MGTVEKLNKFSKKNIFHIPSHLYRFNCILKLKVTEGIAFFVVYIMS